MRFYFGRHSRRNYDWMSLMDSYRRYVSSSSVVLEIGASIRDRTWELARYCERRIGVELLPERVPGSLPKVEYVGADWQYLSDHVEPDSIDVAIASHVIEHVVDDTKAINELFKVLKPGGVGIMNTPNRKRLTRSVIEVFRGERQFPYWEHQREYVENDLVRLLARSDFERYKVVPVALGLHGGPLFCYVTAVPRRLRRFACYWEVHLFK